MVSDPAQRGGAVRGAGPRGARAAVVLLQLVDVLGERPRRLDRLLHRLEQPRFARQAVDLARQVGRTQAVEQQAVHAVAHGLHQAAHPRR